MFLEETHRYKKQAKHDPSKDCRGCELCGYQPENRIHRLR